MTHTELEACLDAEIQNFSGKTSLLAARLEDGRILCSRSPEVQVVSASTIKVPILLAALEEVRQGRLSLAEKLELPQWEILDDTEVFEEDQRSYSLWELLYWMIVESDNTATNRIIRLLGCETINAYARQVLGLSHTVCQRKMLDWEAIRQGRNNYTSALDQFRLYQLLCTGRILTPQLTQTALDILRRQRSMDCILRYIPQQVDFAHKTGGLNHLVHDAGVFFWKQGDCFLGIFTWDGPSPEGDKRQKMYVGRLAKTIFTACYNNPGCFDACHEVIG